MKYFLVLLLVALSEQQNFRQSLSAAVCRTRMAAAMLTANATEATMRTVHQERDNIQGRVNADPTNNGLGFHFGLARTAFLTAAFTDVQAWKLVRNLDEDCNNGANHLEYQAKIDSDLDKLREQSERQINEQLASYNATQNPTARAAIVVQVRALSSLLVSGLRDDINDIQSRLNNESGRSAYEMAGLRTRLDLTNQFVNEYLPYTHFNGTVTPLPLQ